MALALIFSLVQAFTSFANASQHLAQDHFAHLPKGGRSALHGMVLFGSGPYFLEHIPMLTAPHDFQIVTEVYLKNVNGTIVNFDFSNDGFTLKPNSSFSLNDFVAGRLQTFTGSIYQGSFEQNGQVIKGLENVTIEIKSYQAIRQLPGTQSAETSIRLTDGKNFFDSNVIQPGRDTQLIRNLKTGKILWCVKAPDYFEPCHP